MVFFPLANQLLYFYLASYYFSGCSSLLCLSSSSFDSNEVSQSLHSWDVVDISVYDASTDVLFMTFRLSTYDSIVWPVKQFAWGKSILLQLTPYYLSYKENNIQGKKYYTWILYKLHHELGIPLVPLSEEKMLVIQFLLKNPGLFKQYGGGIKHAEVVKLMMGSGYMPDKPIRTKKTR